MGNPKVSLFFSTKYCLDFLRRGPRDLGQKTSLCELELPTCWERLLDVSARPLSLSPEIRVLRWAPCSEFGLKNSLPRREASLCGLLSCGPAPAEGPGDVSEGKSGRRASSSADPPADSGDASSAGTCPSPRFRLQLGSYRRSEYLSSLDCGLPRAERNVKYGSR